MPISDGISPLKRLESSVSSTKFGNFARDGGIGPVNKFSDKYNTSSWGQELKFCGILPESLLDDKLIFTCCWYTPNCSDISSPVSVFPSSLIRTKVVHAFKLLGIGPSNMFKGP